MPDITTSVVNTIRKHFVTLSCVQKNAANGLDKCLVFSGFIVEVAGEWAYITAGHILRDIRLALSKGATFDLWQLGDQTAGSPYSEAPIPYGFNEQDWIVIEDESLGLDYGATHISWLYRRQLEAGGVSAIGKDAWSDHVTEYDFWALIGIPSESINYINNTTFSAKLAFVPLTEVEQPPGAENRAANQFYATPTRQLSHRFPDPDGLSGGPVFSLKKVDSVWLYNLIGIQSGWYPQAKVLAICPFTSFGAPLEEFFLEAMDQFTSEGSDGAA